VTTSIPTGLILIAPLCDPLCAPLCDCTANEWELFGLDVVLVSTITLPLKGTGTVVVVLNSMVWLVDGTADVTAGVEGNGTGIVAAAGVEREIVADREEKDDVALAASAA